jgi:hypothetical protein
MMATDRTALICDLAETYGVLNYKELPVETLAALSVGLREDSRIRMKLSGERVRTETLLLAAMVDRMTFIAWTKTEDAQKGANRPRSIVDIINGKETEGNVLAFDTSEEFEEAKAEIVGKR